MAGILAWFWNERFWLPHNVTWADLQSTEEAAFPQAEDLYLAFPLAFCIFMIRLLFERFIAKPCALGLKVQANGPQKAQPNAILEKVFTAITKHPDEKRLEGLSKQLDWDVRSIQRWFRQRRNQEKPSTLTKFCESMWRFTFYLYIFTYGVRFLKKHHWLPNLLMIKQYLKMLPLHMKAKVLKSFAYYKATSRGSVRGRRYARESKYLGLVRGLVAGWSEQGEEMLQLPPSPAGVFFTSVQCMQCLNSRTLPDSLGLSVPFAIFIFHIIWKILNATLFELYEALGNFPALWVFNVLLVILQILHCFWSYLIIKAAYKAISKGKVAKDDRSDIESSSDEEETVPRSKTPHSTITTNGTGSSNGTNGYLTGGTCSEEH
ncbi:Ceramide synthase 6, partial [Spheniscus mendiculus]